MNTMMAVTCGDPAGVGPEILSALAAKRQLKDCVVFGHAHWLDRLAIPQINKRVVGPAGFRARLGKPTLVGARLALEAMKQAAEGCVRGDFAGVVTGPVSKHWLARIQPEFVGQTEFFAQHWGGNPVMCFAGGRLRLSLATWHVALRKVPSVLTKISIERAVVAAEMLARLDGIQKPRIGVCGLNPHAGERGLLGDEEIRLVNPVLRRLRKKVPGVSASLPSDTLFARALSGEFDAVVALYHDQGLAPLKAVDFDTAVNVTLGLPFVRTSPDHGTAFDIAGKGVAGSTSFSNALILARRLVAFRSGAAR